MSVKHPSRQAEDPVNTSLTPVSPTTAAPKPGLRLCLGIALGSVGSIAARVLGKGSGTSLPGVLALKVQPQILAQLGKQLTGPVVAVTGTNGKTTTSGLIAQLLETAQAPTIHNQLGANMKAGITAALVLQSSWVTGRLKPRKYRKTPNSLKGKGTATPLHGVLEIDEASLKGVAKEVRLDQVVVSNLFRDQLDRYGELDTTARMIVEGIEQTHARKLTLNADDPMVAGMGSYGASAQGVLYFGIESLVTASHLEDADSVVGFPQEVTQCPSCGARLHYGAIWFGHLGHYDCDACGFFRPRPVVLASEVETLPEGSVFILQVAGDTLRVQLRLPGLFNVYNLLAAVAAVHAMGYPVIRLLPEALDHYQSVFGRAERKTVKGKKVVVMLIKNPTGASEVLRLVASDPNGRLMLALNDNDADGRDVSWIWDAMFELLAPAESDDPATMNLKTMVVSGERAEDMALRLKYAGVPEEQLWPEPDLRLAVQQALSMTQPGETLYVLPTYTALLSLRGIL